MLSSMGQRGNAGRAKEIGFAAYLAKPVKRSQLYDCLGTAIGIPTKKGERESLKDSFPAIKRCNRPCEI